MAHDLNERTVELCDELLDMYDELPEGATIGRCIRPWAERTAELERTAAAGAAREAREEEVSNVIAMLEHMGASKAFIKLLERGDHRKRSTKAMKAVRESAPAIIEETRQCIDRMCRTFVEDE